MATSQGSGPSAPHKPPTPIHGSVQLSVEDDGALVIIKAAIYLTPDDATDLCLRLIGHVSRLKGLGARP